MLKNFELSTDANYLKRYLNDTSTIIVPSFGNIASVPIPHTLGYIPNFDIFVDVSDDGVYWSGGEKVEDTTDLSVLTGGSAPNEFLTFDYYATSTNLYISVINNTDPSSSGTRSVDYVVYL